MKCLKRLIALMCLLVVQIVACFDSFAQIRIGAKAGWAHSLMNVTSDEYKDNYNSFGGGFVFSYKLNNTFSVRADLLYSKRGYEVDDGAINDEGNFVDVDVSFDYLNVPIVFEYFPFEFLYLQAGPQFDVQLGRKLYYDNHKMPDELFGGKQWLGVGVTLGAGVIYKDLFVELQYCHGFTGAFKNSKDNFKARTLLLTVGIFVFNLN